MPQIGSNPGLVAQNLSAITDSQGNQIISNENAFGASPAGEALIGQQLFGLPNGTFNLTPPDVYSSLGSDNRLPYWDWAEYSDGTMTATPTYDSATQTWGIKINPGTAANGDYCTLTTRSFLLNDDNLGLRQKAFAVISKGGTAAASTQWNLTLSAIYYDTTNTAIGTAAIGTALDTGTWTSLSGFTTAGGSAINASARYVELQFKLTATAAVTGSATVTIKSCLLSSKIGANSSFLITETFTSSTTWTVPTGVTKVDVIAMGGGGGGGAGGGYRGSSTTYSARGGGGGGAAAFTYSLGVNVSGSASITIGIGTAGAGGAGIAASGTTTGNNGGAGGASSFGTLVVANGGVGGIGGDATIGGTATGSGGTGSAGGTVGGGLWSPSRYDGKSGGNSGVYNGNGVLQSSPTAGGDSTLTGFTSLPYYGALNPAAGANGGATGGIAGVGGGGGAGAAMSGGAGTRVTGTPSNGGAGGGGGGGTAAFSSSGTANAQAGGAAGTASGAGGGGGGVAATATGVANTGSGGNGGSGAFVAVIYTA